MYLNYKYISFVFVLFAFQYNFAQNNISLTYPNSPSSNLSIIEGSNQNNGSKIINFMVALNSIDQGVQVGIKFEIISKSAQEHKDVRLIGQSSYILSKNNLRHNFQLSIIQDNSYEYDEYFEIKITSLNSAYFFQGAPSKLIRINIKDDDSPGNTTVDEGDEGMTAVDFILQRKTRSFTQTILVETYDIEAKTADNDYQYKKQSVEFAPYQTTAIFSVNIIGDTHHEAPESFGIRRLQFNDIELLQKSAIIKDSHDLNPSLEIAVKNNTLNETDTEFSIEFKLSNRSYLSYFVLIFTKNGTAKSNEDYKPDIKRLTFPANTLSKTVKLSIINDTYIEQDEYFFLEISDKSFNLNFDENNRLIQLFIQDDDSQKNSIKLVHNNRMVENNIIEIIEGDPPNISDSFIVFRLAKPANTPIEFTLETQDSSALSSTDYQHFIQTLTIPANSLESHQKLSLKNDFLNESDESFKLKIKGNDDILDLLLSGDEIEVQIKDDDKHSLSFQPKVLFAKESFFQKDVILISEQSLFSSSEITLDIAVKLNKALAYDLNIPITITPINATENSDFKINTSNIFIQKGSKEPFTPLKVTILQDPIQENNESFLIAFDSVRTIDEVFNAKSFTITILDDDEFLNITTGLWDPNSFLISEKTDFIEGNGTSSIIAIEIDRKLAPQSRKNETDTIWLSWDKKYHNQSGSFASKIPQDQLASLENNDFTLSSLQTTIAIVFSPHEESKVITLTILGDIFPEKDEIVFFNSFFTLQTQTLYRDLNDVINAGLDILQTEHQFNILNDDDTIAFRIIDDGARIVEFDENNVANIKFLEGNPGDFSEKIFEFTFLTLPEDFNLLTTIILKEIKIDTHTLDDDDFKGQKPSLLTLTFQPLQPAKTFSLKFQYDEIYEYDEMVRYELFSPDFNLSTKPLILNIFLENDDLPSITLKSISYSPHIKEASFSPQSNQILINESDIDQHYTLWVDIKNSVRDIPYMLSTEDGTAFATKLDYKAQIIKDTIAVSETLYPLPFTILGDDLFENVETFYLKMNIEKNIFSFPIQIDNDDFDLPLIGYNIAFSSISEGNLSKDEKSFNVNFFYLDQGNIPGIETLLRYEIIDISASAGSDFIASKKGSIALNERQREGNINIPIIADTDYEEDEKFLIKIFQVSNGILKNGNLITCTIKNDDDLPAKEIFENEAFYPLIITKSRTVDFPTSVRIKTVYKTATPGDDYGFANKFTDDVYELTFPANHRVGLVKIPLLDDQFFEDLEVFNVAIVSHTHNHNFTLQTNEIHIIDDEQTPSIITEIANVLEGSPGSSRLISFPVFLDPAINKKVVIDFTIEEGSALAHDDYIPTTLSLTFQPFQTAKIIQVPIVSDFAIEDTEIMYLSIINSNLDYIGIKHLLTTGTIIDNDRIPPPPLVHQPVFMGQSLITGTLNELHDTEVFLIVLDENQQTLTIQSAPLINKQFSINLGNSNLILDQYNIFVYAKNNTGISERKRIVPIISSLNTEDLFSQLSSDLKINEGNDGSTMVIINIPTPKNLFIFAQVDYQIREVESSGISARLNDDDFQDVIQTLLIDPDKQSNLLTLSINGDTTFESNESFQLCFFNFKDIHINTTLETICYNGVIVNDDTTLDVKIANWKISPNGDGFGSDKLVFSKINKYPNRVTIFDKTGFIVFQEENYDNINIVFDGKGKDGSFLVDGTYYYDVRIFRENDKNIIEEFILNGYIHLRK